MHSNSSSLVCVWICISVGSICPFFLGVTGAAIGQRDAYNKEAARDNEVLFDSLCITDNYEYAYGYTNSCGGEAVFGQAYDLQLADDFQLVGSSFLTSVTEDYVTYLGLCPRRLCLSFHERSDEGFCLAENEASSYSEVTDRIICEPFEDLVFGLKGLRVRVELALPVRLREGYWFMSLQPSFEDWAFSVAVNSAPCGEPLCGANYRDGGDRNPCCDGLGYFGHEDWDKSDISDPLIAMRIEGIPAGDCVGGEEVSSRCKPGGGERLGKIVVKVRGGQAGGTVTALRDPPDPRDIRIPLDDRGRGKGKFKDVPPGNHRVFVCDSIVDVTCSP